MVKRNLRKLNRKNIEIAFRHLSFDQLLSEATMIYEDLEEVVELNLDRIPEEFVHYSRSLVEEFNKGNVNTIAPFHLSMAYIIWRHPWEANDYYFENGIIKHKIHWRFFYT